jgi:ABC-type multidrug transport system fused ATPase/permease subunit
MIAAVPLPLRLLGRERRALAALLGASLGRAVLAAASILLIREFLGGVLGERDGPAGRLADAYGRHAALWALAGLLLCTHVAAGALAYAAQLAQHRMAAAVELATLERLVRQVLRLSVRDVDRRSRGDLAHALRQDVAHLSAVTLAAAGMLLESFQAVALLAAAVYLSPRLALWGFLVVPLAAAPAALLARRALAQSFGVRRRAVIVIDRVLQLLAALRVIRIYQGEEAEAARTIAHARGYYEDLLSMERVRALARAAIDSLAGLSLVIVLVVGGFEVLQGTLGWPELLAFLMAARATHGPINLLNAHHMAMQRYGSSVEAIDRVLADVPEVADRPGARPLTRGPSMLAGEGLTLSFDGVRILDGVSFHVRSGETLGVVGPSGAGKTTLLNLIARFHDPDAGVLRVDGVDVRDLRLSDYQARMAMVTQDPFLFATTILENIRCGRPSASREEVEEAARVAEVHDDIVGMPEGYETVVGPGGRALSRGEAQRIEIARAVIKDAPLLLLDEPTSSLDPHTEAAVRRALHRLAAGRVTIAVAHRLPLVRDAARILVLEGGRVVGAGTHDTLLERSPTYRRLWEAQGWREVATPWSPSW